MRRKRQILNFLIFVIDRCKVKAVLLKLTDGADGAAVCVPCAVQGGQGTDSLLSQTVL